MNYNFGNISDQLLEVSKYVYGGEDNKKSLIQECIDFQEKWNIKIGAEMFSTQHKHNFIEKFKSAKNKLLCNTKQCVILGRTSSGKSTLINALLSEAILPANFGSTTNCFVKITASSNNENYLLINNMKKNIEEMEDLNNLLSSGHLENGSDIIMFYDKNKCQLLKDDVVIIDTPGYDSGIFNNDVMKQYFIDADIVVLVVSAQSGINNEDEILLKRYKTELKKLKLIIMYNFWDVVNPKDQNGRVKMQLLSKAKNILKELLSIVDPNADAFIYFVSSSERMIRLTLKDSGKINSGATNSVNSDPLWNERNTSFELLFDYLKNEMSESLFKKKCFCLQNLKSMLESSLDQCQNCINLMNKNRVNLGQNIRKELENIKGLYAEVYQIISEIFNSSFERLIIEGLQLLKTDKTKVEKKKRDNARNDGYEIISLSGSSNEITNRIYRELLERITHENLENARKKIIDFIKHEDTNVSFIRQNIFNEIYFPFYFNLNKALNSFNIETFKDNLIKINRIIKISSGITIGVSGFLAAGALAATGGVLFPILGLAEIAIVAVGATGGGLGGGVIGVGAAFGGIKHTKLPFRFAWKDAEIAIREFWNVLESDLMNNYSTFIDNMESNVAELITPLQEKAVKIQNKLNSIEEELQKLTINTLN